MSKSRSLANLKLYHARIVAQSWRVELERESVQASVLAGAFDGACRHHLKQAYGWFLLEIADPDLNPDSPPGCVEQLPPVSAGKVLPPEIRELSGLERSGWLFDMLSVQTGDNPVRSTTANLASQPTTVASPDQVDQWIELLTRTFDRMSDSLDEY